MAPCVPMLSRLALVSRLRSRAPGGWRGRRALGPGPPLVNCSSSERNGARYQRPLDCRALRARPRSKGVCARQISGTSHARRTWDVVGATVCAPAHMGRGGGNGVRFHRAYSVCRQAAKTSTGATHYYITNYAPVRNEPPPRACGCAPAPWECARPPAGRCLSGGRGLAHVHARELRQLVVAQPVRPALLEVPRQPPVGPKDAARLRG